MKFFKNTLERSQNDSEVYIELLEIEQQLRNTKTCLYDMIVPLDNIEFFVPVMYKSDEIQIESFNIRLHSKPYTLTNSFLTLLKKLRNTDEWSILGIYNVQLSEDLIFASLAVLDNSNELHKRLISLLEKEQNYLLYKGEEKWQTL
jgi:hypothetical protein